jgi:RES domain-containing protein
VKHDFASLRLALSKAPARAIKAQLVRLVPFQHLVSVDPPDWLFTSGKPNRYNTAGVECVYFGESKDVAELENEDQFSGLFGKRQPVTIYYANVVLNRVMDLTDSQTLRALKLDVTELSKNWRRTKAPTSTQLLGKAVSETAHFSAIRYPSQAAAKHGRTGANYVIFRDCVQSPDSVVILGPTRRPLQKWP